MEVKDSGTVVPSIVPSLPLRPRSIPHNICFLVWKEQGGKAYKKEGILLEKTEEDREQRAVMLPCIPVTLKPRKMGLTSFKWMISATFKTLFQSTHQGEGMKAVTCQNLHEKESEKR